MPRLKIILRARNPLALGSGLAVGSVQESRDYVAGSVWRGAVAQAMLQAQNRVRHAGRPVSGAPEPDFAELFWGEQAARFGFLYPASSSGVAAMPIPLTVRSCKQKPGFAPSGHGVYDGLLNRLREAAAGQQPYSRSSEHCARCEHNQGRLERKRGFMNRTSADQNDYGEARVERRAFVRVGLNRLTETAQEEVLYTIEALVPTQGGRGEGEDDYPSLTFIGSWSGNTAQRQTLLDKLAEYRLPDSDGYNLTVGTARARGMGAAVLHLESGDDDDPVNDLAARLDHFQPITDGRFTDPDHLFAALTLRSPLLLVDERGLPATELTGALLRAYHPQAPANLEVLADYSVLERETWTGWAAAWGLPKPVTTVISAGSVIVMRAPTAQRAELLDYLATLAAEGLGERRAEGFGEVLVCDSFHIAFDEKE